MNQIASSTTHIVAAAGKVNAEHQRIVEQLKLNLHRYRVNTDH
jgi:hypothetical protein